MIHTKLLIRRLAYVPWLLAVGLMLGWAGEAQAQRNLRIDLSLDKQTIREDGGAATITVTAKAKVATEDSPDSTLTADTYIITQLTSTQEGLNDRFTITLPTIKIPKDKASATGEAVITPVNNDAFSDEGTNLSIIISGVGGSTVDSFGDFPSVLLIDDDQPTDQIHLSVSPAEISQEAGPTTVTVTATMDGETSTKKSLSFPLIVVSSSAYTTSNPSGDGGADAPPSDPLDVALIAPSGTQGVRDTDYNITGLGSITIPRKKVKGTATFVIDPKKGPRWIGIGTPVVPASATTALRYDGSGTADDYDSDSDGTADSREEQVIQVVPTTLKISEALVAAIKDDGMTATPASIREEVGATEIALKIVLKTALTDDAEVDFSIKTEDNASRDINYTISFGDLTIPAGATEGTTTATLTPFNDDAVGGNRTITVMATVANSTKTTDITITDDDALTENITLSATPASVSEDAGDTEVTITATLDGKVFDEDQKLTLVLNTEGTAQRDVDYTAIIRSVTIPAGEISGSTTISVSPVDDGAEDKDETILVKASNELKNDDDDVIKVADAKITLKDTGVKAVATPTDGTPAFTADDIAASDTVIEGVAGSALSMEMPAASGDGTLMYTVSSNLPAGLAFDAATRTLSGTPTMAGTTEITYTVLDGDMGDQLPAESAALTYIIEVAPTPAPTVSVASVTTSHSSLRENGETTSISITAKLAAAAPVAETIKFTLGSPGSGVMAIRDVDFTASLHGNVAVAVGDMEATTTLVLTPIDNGNEDGNRIIGVHATASGGAAMSDIKIADDETASTSISLSADPHTVSEADGVTNVTITATLDGKVLAADATVVLSVDPGSQATRDADYSALFNPTLTIPAGQVSGAIVLLIDPTGDDADEGNETITLNGAISGLADGTGIITISDAEAPMMDPLAFAEGAMIADVAATAGTAVAEMELPAASGGSGDITYSVSELPAGLAFDAATRMISGMPEASGTTEVTYTATDAGGSAVTLTFSITVNPMLDFGDLGALFGAFNNGAGKANPAAEIGEDGVIRFVAGMAEELTLPEVSGGTPPLTYSVAGLPAGLTFDAATRTVSGTPTAVSDIVTVTYMVTDASGASSVLPFLVAVVDPPLGAPGNLVAQDYAGADGQGDQGGFILLTWELSEHHAGIDGYRIFRALPVLGNEMVPWAMVDAVPGVDRGVAIVATLDNVSTRWGIAAERGGQTTHGAAKAVFVSAENPYELMTETLQASIEAAQVGDGPVFASLLPEALAYAQGVAPKLKGVEGVQSSAIIITDEAVRAIDNIAPLAVPSFSVLDAPNDEGSRIALTWTLSPSDRVLQDVVAGAIGPLGVEPVVGVYGYSIYRSAAGEDEFVLVGQVDAGVTSFVDETALNGVHYTYQVRPYDLDNETAAVVEHTAMAVRNIAVDSEGRTISGLFGSDSRIGFDDFFIFADNFGLTAEDAGFDPAFDLAPSAVIDFDDFFVFADNFGRSIAAAGKRVPMFAGLNADARMYLDARTALPNVGEDFVLDVRLADFAAIKGYGLQVQYEADKLQFVEVRTDQPLGGSELATPQVLADQAGVLTVAAHGDIVADGEVALSLVFRPTTEIENTVIEIADNQTYDSEFGFNRLALPAPVQVQTRPEVFSLANNYPNPFNPATTIKYALPQAADVELTVYNVLGQPVRTLVAEHQNAGRYVVEWDATNDSGHSLSSGMYFYRLEAGGDLEVKKMLLLK